MCTAIELIPSRPSSLAYPDLDPVSLCSWTLALPSGHDPPLFPVHEYKQLLCIGKSSLVNFLLTHPSLGGKRNWLQYEHYCKSRLQSFSHDFTLW